MRIRELLREAGRNIRCGASRAVPLTLIAATISIVCSISDLSATAQLADKVDQYVAAGGATAIVEAPGEIDGTACDSLINTGRVSHSGALRRVNPTGITSLTGNPLPTFEASSGWWSLMSLDPTSSIAISDSTAEVIAPRLGRGNPVMVDDVNVDDRFTWPEDGRRNTISYGLIARGAAGRFDECWAQALDPSDDIKALLASTTTTSAFSPQQPQHTALNPRLGRLTALDDAQNRPTRFSWLLAALVGAVIGFGSVRLRAVEHAQLKALGLGATSHILLALVEALAWLVTAGVLSSSFALVFTGWVSAQHATDLRILGIAAPAALSATAILTVPLAIVWTRRRGLDHYLRARSG